MKKSKKTIVLIILLSVLTLGCVLFAVLPRHFLLLSSYETDGKTVEIRGLFGQGMEAVAVDGNGKIIFHALIWCDKDATVIFSDLNFDGTDDITVVKTDRDDVQTNAVYLCDASSGRFKRSASLSKINNLRASELRGGLFGYEKETVYEADKGKSTAVYHVTEKVTKYVWDGDTVKPDVQLRFTHYSETGMVLYQSLIYDEGIADFGYANDDWLTEEEFQNTDLSFFYYFK